MSAPPTLAPGRWPDHVRRALDATLVRLAELAASGTPPIAVFDFDNTCISNDIGEAFHLWMATHGGYRLDGPFLDLLDPRDGRDAIVQTSRALAAATASGDDAAVRTHRATLRALVFATYARHMAHAGKGPTYQWQVGLLAGIGLDDLGRCVDRCIADALTESHELEDLGLDDGTGASIQVRRGFSTRPEIVDLMRCIEQVGGEVWVCSASMTWLVGPFAERHYGVPRERVLAARTRVGPDGLMTDEIVPPVAFSAGKVQLVEQHIGRVPAFSAGDSMTDWEMLAHTEGDVLVFDRDPKLTARAIARGWIVCPMLESLG